MDILISPNDFVLNLMHMIKPHITSISELTKILKKAAGDHDSRSAFTSSPLNGTCRRSFYNYIVHTESGYLIYNTLYNSLIRLQQNEYKMFMNPAICSEEYLYNFVKSGLFIDKSVNEKESYLFLADIFMHCIDRNLNLTITTTLKCNAHCPYCYEHGVQQSDMFPGAAEKILQFIRHQKKHEKIELTWFGGEPLLNTSLIDEICSSLSASGIEFSSFMITNGSLFKKSTLNKQIFDWHLKNVQISLDGTSDIHNRVKSFSSGDNDFYSIMYSIRQLTKNKIHVGLRLNISRTNFQNVMNLIKELEYMFSADQYVSYYPAFIVGTGDSFSPEEKVACLKKILKGIKDYRKVTAETRFYSIPKTHSCHNSDHRAFTIDVFGNIFTCEHYVGRKEKALSTLDKYNDFDDPRENHLEIASECKECLFLPKCFGGCEANRRENNDPCLLEKYLIPAYMELL